MPLPKKNKDKILRAIFPNAGLEALYKKRLTALIDEMGRSVSYFMLAQYRKDPPELLGLDPDDGPLAADASPTAELQRQMKDLGDRWRGRFDDAAKELAAYFSKAAADRSDIQLRAILRKAGFSVKFRMTRAMNDVVQAAVQENVELIRNIPEKYLLDVQGAVMRSAQTGRDAGQLAKDLQEKLGITKRRASFIARDQSNKATASVANVRYRELGIEFAEWRHSGGGREPRPSHVKAGKDHVRYKVSEGWLDPHLNKRIWPGTEPNCRCVARALIPGFV